MYSESGVRSFGIAGSRRSPQDRSLRGCQQYRTRHQRQDQEPLLQNVRFLFILALANIVAHFAFAAIFKWVRGELIGKGNFGRVYMALNATTGEMIAVKQVEIPRTASDKNDSRQVTVVEALKLESETLKDLDHTNIVQYLGFEETPNFLSMYVASFLRRVHF